MTARSNGDGSRPQARAARRALAAGAIAAALLGGLTPKDVAAATRTLVLASAATGGPGAAVTYDYTWDRSCQNISNPVIVLTWDDTAATVIGMVSATSTATRCVGTVTGHVPSNATARVHYAGAHVQDKRGAVLNSGVQAGEGFTVIQPPTPTPRPTPAPTPTPTAAPTATPAPTPADTPLPTDTPTAIPSESPTSTPSDSSAIPAGNAGASTPPGALVLVGIVAVLVIAAATAGAVLLARRRRPRPNQVNDDPFQFLR